MFKDEKKIDWLNVLLQDVGVAVAAGAILGGVINGLSWLGFFLLAVISVTLCYTSFKLLDFKK